MIPQQLDRWSLPAQWVEGQNVKMPFQFPWNSPLRGYLMNASANIWIAEADSHDCKNQSPSLLSTTTALELKKPKGKVHQQVSHGHIPLTWEKKGERDYPKPVQSQSLNPSLRSTSRHFAEPSDPHPASLKELLELWPLEEIGTVESEFGFVEQEKGPKWGSQTAVLVPGCETPTTSFFLDPHWLHPPFCGRKG